VSTITASDYSVELLIEKKAFKRWREEVYYQSQEYENGVSMAMALKNHLKKCLEKNLTEI
jgi:hypothetical protein